MKTISVALDPEECKRMLRYFPRAIGYITETNVPKSELPEVIGARQFFVDFAMNLAAAVALADAEGSDCGCPGASPEAA